MHAVIRDFLDRRRSTILFCAALGFFLFSWAGFVFTPMTGDIKVFMASANQSNYISKELIIGAFKAWELKSVFSRTLMYLIYKIACLFTSYGTQSFEITSKFVYSLLIIAGSYFSMFFLSGTDRIKTCFYSLITASLFFAMHTCCQMQVEMTVAMTVLMAYALYINATKNETHTLAKLLCSGALIGSAFYYKSILILLSVSVVAAVAIYLTENGQELSVKRMMTVASGSVLLLTVILLLIVIINPAEIQDMINASHFQKTLFDQAFSIKIPFRILKPSLQSLPFIPVVFAGVIALCFNLTVIVFYSRHSSTDKKMLALFHLVMWAMPMIFVAVSFRFFVYHYATFIFPAMIELYYAFKFCRTMNRKEWKFNYALTGLMTLAVLLAGWYTANFSVLSGSFRNYNRENARAYTLTGKELSLIDFDSRETVLYLDDGRGGYCLGNPSYLKYYFPLPLQRLPEDSDLPCHTESLEAVMNYDGKYIALYDTWFFENNTYEEFRNYIYTEYEPVAFYYVFTPPFSLDQNKVEKTPPFTIFQKKDTEEQNTIVKG